VKAESPGEDSAKAALPTPEEVFFAWLLNLPDDVDPSVAAAEEIARLDSYKPRSTDAQKLRQLFQSAVDFGISKRRMS
jgi:hypothetical protein